MRTQPHHLLQGGHLRGAARGERGSGWQFLSPGRGRRGDDEARQSSRAIPEVKRALQGSEQGYLLGGRARLVQLQLEAPASSILSPHRLHGSVTGCV